jgi:hypothetical protein
MLAWPGSGWAFERLCERGLEAHNLVPKETAKLHAPGVVVIDQNVFDR